MLTIEPGLYVPMDAEDVPNGAGCACIRSEPLAACAIIVLRSGAARWRRSRNHEPRCARSPSFDAPRGWLLSSRRDARARRADRGRRARDQGEAGGAQRGGARRLGGDGGVRGGREEAVPLAVGAGEGGGGGGGGYRRCGGGGRRRWRGGQQQQSTMMLLCAGSRCPSYHSFTVLAKTICYAGWRSSAA